MSLVYTSLFSYHSAISYPVLPYLSVFQMKNLQISVADGWHADAFALEHPVADFKWHNLKYSKDTSTGAQDMVVVFAACKDSVKTWDANSKASVTELKLVLPISAPIHPIRLRTISRQVQK